MFHFFKKYYLVDYLEAVTDIHNHLLPGIDDGASDLETSLEMVALFKELGFSQVICTPHTMEDYYNNDVEKIKKVFQQTQSQFAEHGFGDFLLAPASEYMMDGNFEHLLDENNFLCLFKNFILTELSYFQKPENMDHLVFKMRQMGLNPIMAHPERYRYVQKLSEYQDWIKRGFKLQLNLLSLGNHYGADAYKKSKVLLEKDMYSFIATDAHGPRHLKALKEVKIKQQQVQPLINLVANHQNTLV